MMKAFKRNAVVVTILLFVCAAVYLNWSYNEKTEDAETAGQIAEDQQKEKTSEDQKTDSSGEESGDAMQEQESAGLFYTGDGSENMTQTSVSGGALEEYFDQVRLDRQQARDEASMTLETVASAEGASQETVDEALGKMTQIAEWTAKEAELENLITAKGFTDCVVYLSENGASVTVAADGGLTESSVAQITDVIINETEFTADQLKVIEIK